MADEGFKRKLTAILSADVVGYSRLMEDNEEATIRTLNTYRNSMSTLIQQHRGRVVDTTGDNLMAEFSSVVDAVKCAVETQKEMNELNADLLESRRMLFRIGVNLGDIVEEDDRIYGDGVNIAARLEGLAEAGGICISRTAYEHVKNKLELGYEYLGEHSVKNISEPIHVYRVLMKPEAAGKVIGEKRDEKRWMALAAVIVLLIGVGGLVGWYLYIEQTKRIEPASLDKMAFSLPDKPSIVVLPFTNMSDDPKQEYFVDGLTEEIITGLSKVPYLFVIARNSSFTYKGNPVKIKQVAEELGVRYVLEGSIRKSENDVRITAQLIDATTGYHLWAERYDRDVKDIFAIQDDITMKIITELQVKLTHGEQARPGKRDTNNIEAFLKVLRGGEQLDRNNKEAIDIARKMFEDAISIDPEYATAYSLLGYTHMLDVYIGSSKSPKESIAKGVKLAEQAIFLDDSNISANSLLGYLYTLMRQHDKAVSAAARAVNFAPSSTEANISLARALLFSGRTDEAILYYEKAIRLNPFPPTNELQGLCSGYRQAGRYEEAIAACKKALHVEPNNLLAHLLLAASYSASGNTEKANMEVSEILRINPKFSLRYWAEVLPYKNKADTNQLISVLRQAGLPE
jgi:adenylate cyclase